MAEIWRLLDTGALDAATNMAVDEAILWEHRAGRVPPTLRFYAWDPPALSLGYAQSLEKEVDLAILKAKGFGLVRRLTGGRAVLHDKEITYSIVVREDHPLMAGGVLPSYLRVARALAKGLELLGVRVEIASGRQKVLSQHTSAACFDAPSWYEITVGGRKLIGSAQTRKGGVVLQHGSLVLRQNVEDLFAVLKFTFPEKRQELQAEFARRACGLEEVLGRPISKEEVKEAIVRSFEELYDLRLLPGKLTSGEEKRVEELRVKYSSPEWNARR